MDRLLHQILKAARFLQVISILGIDYLEKDLLYISLVCLVLHDLAELNPVDFGRYESLNLVEKTFLLRKYRLQSCGNLRGHKMLVDILIYAAESAAIFLVVDTRRLFVSLEVIFALYADAATLQLVQLLEQVIVVTYLAIEHLDALEQTV